jgi:methionine aminopeptidase
VRRNVCSDLGAHIDGFVAVQATTVVVQDGAAPITGRTADALACANTCFEAALRLIRPGKRVADVAGPLNKIAEAYGCSMVEGVMTHNMKQFVIDGNKCVLNKPTAEQKVEDDDFLEHEVYAVDIVVSTGTSTIPDVRVCPASCGAHTLLRMLHG